MVPTWSISSFSILFSVGLSLSLAQQQEDRTQYVNTFHGSVAGGNTFPGVVAAPFAVVKLGPDVRSGNADAYSGYLPDGNITGFSMLHESGTGGAPKYGVVSQMPVAGEVGNPLGDLSATRSSADESSVGYYKSSLAGGITVQLAATEHAGMYKYTFPQGRSSVVVDVSHVLPSFRGLGWGQEYVEGSFDIKDDGSYEGRGVYNNGWNLSPPWTIYFCGKFDRASGSSATFSGSGTEPSYYGPNPSVSGNERLGGVFSFDVSEVTSTVGVSWISASKACRFRDDEISETAKLQDLVDAAKSRWIEEVFSKVSVKSSNTTDLSLLYSSLYGMHLIPSNRTGENPLWESSEPYYDDIFTFWDLFRCSTALTHILQPVSYEEQIRSLIDVWRNDGYLPDGRSSNFNGRTQGGSNADNVFADAYVKGVRGRIDWEDGYAAMVKNAEEAPPNNNDPIAKDSSTKEGRGALPDWIEYGYITPAFSRAVSRAVEYAGNDFALYQVAAGLGKAEDAAKYLRRSRNWRNHWNSNAETLGETGFMVPRNGDGSFVETDPLSCGGCYWGDAYYQGLPYEYSLNAHHDAQTLIDWSGGPERFAGRLEKMFLPGTVSTNPRFNNTIFNPANEPSFTTPYLYNFVGRQDLSVKQSRDIARKYYQPTADGIPGNSDAGAMQTWLLWNMIGLYPITGQTTFLIGSPWFPEMTIDLGGGKELVITAREGASGDAVYVQSLRVNGDDWDRAWVAWGDVFEGGGTMEFVLGASPRNWAVGAPPPSPASGDKYLRPRDGTAASPRRKRESGDGSGHVKFIISVALSASVAVALVVAAVACWTALGRASLSERPWELEKHEHQHEQWQRREIR